MLCLILIVNYGKAEKGGVCVFVGVCCLLCDASVCICVFPVVHLCVLGGCVCVYVCVLVNMCASCVFVELGNYYNT